jgi:hypothetical protein
LGLGGTSTSVGGGSEGKGDKKSASDAKDEPKEAQHTVTVVEFGKFSAGYLSQQAEEKWDPPVDKDTLEKIRIHIGIVMILFNSSLIARFAWHCAGIGTNGFVQLHEFARWVKSFGGFPFVKVTDCLVAADSLTATDFAFPDQDPAEAGE